MNQIQDPGSYAKQVAPFQAKRLPKDGGDVVQARATAKDQRTDRSDMSPAIDATSVFCQSGASAEKLRGVGISVEGATPSWPGEALVQRYLLPIHILSPISLLP